MKAMRVLLRFGLLQGWRAAGEVSAAELEQWLAEGRKVQLLDIRGVESFQAGHLPGARHLPLDRLERELATLDRGLATVVY